MSAPLAHLTTLSLLNALPPPQGKLDAEVLLSLMRQLGSTTPSSNAAAGPSVLQRSATAAGAGLKAFEVPCKTSSLKLVSGSSVGPDQHHHRSGGLLRPKSTRSTQGLILIETHLEEPWGVLDDVAGSAPFYRGTSGSSSPLPSTTPKTELSPPMTPDNTSLILGPSGPRVALHSRLHSVTSSAGVAAQAPSSQCAFALTSNSVGILLNSTVQSSVMEEEEEEGFLLELKSGAAGEGEGKRVVIHAEGEEERVLGGAAAIGEYNDLKSVMRAILCRPSKRLPSLAAAVAGGTRRVEGWVGNTAVCVGRACGLSRAPCPPPPL